MTITIRSFTYNDMVNIITLLNKDRENSHEYRPLTNETFRSWLQEGRLRIVVAERDGQFLGSAGYQDGFWGEEISWLITSDGKEKRLAETLLLEQAEKYVRKGMLFAVVDEGSPKVEEWRQRGYELEGGLYHMLAKLCNEKTLPSIPDGVVLRSLKKDEETAFVEAVNLGFQSERVKIGDLQKWKQQSPPFDEEWISVAEIDTKMVSVVVAKPDTWYNEFFKGRRGYLGPATTLPEYRGRNIVSALTVRAMNFLLIEGMDSVALYTSETNAASFSLLTRIGFEVTHHWRFMRKHFDNPTRDHTPRPDTTYQQARAVMD